MSYPSVTIGVLTYNRVNYLKTSLNSAFNQDYKNILEILVINDGSTDGTKKYLDSLNNPKLKVINFKENRKRPKARNEVLKIFKGDFLIWLDDDDELAYNAVREQVSCYLNNPDSHIIYCNHVKGDSNLFLEKEIKSKEVEDRLMLMQLIYEDIIPNGGTLISREAINRVGFYDERKLRCQDFDFFVRAALKKCKFIHNDKPLYHFRYHENNLANPENIKDQSKYHTQIVKYVLENSNLEDIFPILPWKENPKESVVTALTMLSKIFFDHGDDESSLDCVKKAETFLSTIKARLMKAFILKQMDKKDEALDAFSDVVKDLFPELSYMNLPPRTYRGSLSYLNKKK